MNEVDRDLLDGLRALAADGPSGAPADVEKRVKEQFRKHKRRRRLTAWTLLSAAAGVALLLVTHGERPKSLPAQVVSAEESDTGFYPLPQAEGLPAVENAMVVRVELPVSSLQWMGVPLGDERADASVEADLLLGQDGLARGVRLVQ